MSETAKKLFDGLRAMKDGLQHGALGAARQTAPEISRLGTQGAMELASALFNGGGFVPYGPGQYTPSPPGDLHQQQQYQLDRGMER